LTGRKVSFAPGRRGEHVKYVNQSPGWMRYRYPTEQLFCEDISARVTMSFCIQRCGIAKKKNCRADIWHVHKKQQPGYRYRRHDKSGLIAANKGAF
jgi:hypothetical protein